MSLKCFSFGSFVIGRIVRNFAKNVSSLEGFDCDVTTKLDTFLCEFGFSKGRNEFYANKDDAFRKH